MTSLGRCQQPAAQEEQQQQYEHKLLFYYVPQVYLVCINSCAPLAVLLCVVYCLCSSNAPPDKGPNNPSSSSNRSI